MIPECAIDGCENPQGKDAEFDELLVCVWCGCVLCAMHAHWSEAGWTCDVCDPEAAVGE